MSILDPNIDTVIPNDEYEQVLKLCKEITEYADHQSTYCVDVASLLGLKDKPLIRVSAYTIEPYIKEDQAHITIRPKSASQSVLFVKLNPWSDDNELMDHIHAEGFDYILFMAEVYGGKEMRRTENVYWPFLSEDNGDQFVGMGLRERYNYARSMSGFEPMNRTFEAICTFYQAEQ